MTQNTASAAATACSLLICMPSWIIILKRIRPPISKPIIIDQHARVRHNRIGADEHPHQWIIVARVHVDQRTRIAALTRKVDVGWQPVCGVASVGPVDAPLAVGTVALLGRVRPRTSCDRRDAAQLIRVQILQRGPSAHGDGHAAEGVIFLDGGSAHLVVTKGIEGGGRANRLLDPNAVLIIQVLLARDAVQAVLHVPDEGLAAGTGFGVAVGVVGVARVLDALARDGGVEIIGGLESVSPYLYPYTSKRGGKLN